MRIAPGATIFAVALAVAPAAAFPIRYVDPAATGAANGTSWADAFPSLQTALANAQAGDELRVAAGRYTPTTTLDRSATFALKSGVALRGGFVGLAGPDPDERNPTEHPSILSGDIGQPAVAGDNSFHVVSATSIDATAILDGFEIADGNADATSPNDSGAGLFLSNAAPTLTFLLIHDNRATGTGAGLYAGGLVAPAISACTFANNAAGNSGGGAFCLLASPHFDDCLFSANSALSGGGLAAFVSDLSLTHCDFASNSCEIAGGGAYFSSGAPLLSDCDFRENVALNNSNAANDGGGALYLSSADASVLRCRFTDNLTTDDGGGAFVDGAAPDFVACLFLGNTAADNGGGLFGKNRGGDLVGCAFSGNDAFDAGGAIYELGGTPVMSHCTLSRNSANAANSAGGTYAVNAALTVADSILWNNTAPGGMNESAQVRISGGSLQIRYSCVTNWTGTLGGVGNISAAPAFVSSLGTDGVAGTDDDDLHLKSTSPCIDAGDAASAHPGETDFDGQPRVMGCRVDIGADERTLGLPASGDFDGNGLVNGDEIAPFVAVFLNPSVDRLRCIADINSDLVVDAADFALFLNLLLAPTP